MVASAELEPAGAEDVAGSLDHEGRVRIARYGWVPSGSLRLVLSDNVFACSEDDIKDVTPVLTMVGGEVVFQRAELRDEETERS